MTLRELSGAGIELATVGELTNEWGTYLQHALDLSQHLNRAGQQVVGRDADANPAAQNSNKKFAWPNVIATRYRRSVGGVNGPTGPLSLVLRLFLLPRPSYYFSIRLLLKW